MPKFSLPQNVNMFRSRHGTEFCYHQRGRGTKSAGPRTRIPGLPFNPDGSPNEVWWKTYRALEGLAEAGPAPATGTFAALIKEREASPEWANLAESTRTEWERYHKHVEAMWGDLLVRGLEPRHVLKLRDDFADVPPADPEKRTKALDEYKNRQAAANNLLRALSATIGWSIPRGWRSDNPCDHVPKLSTGDGYVPWPQRAIDHLRKHATRHLKWVALVALYTGQRQSDCLVGSVVRREATDKGEVLVALEPAAVQVAWGLCPRAW